MDPRCLAVLVATICVVYGAKQFDFVANNQLKQPYFTATETGIRIKNKQPLYLYIQELVLKNGSSLESFQVTFTRPYGYFTNAINGVAANFTDDSSYWNLRNQSGSLPLGIFTYEPKDGEVVTFNLTVEFTLVAHNQLRPATAFTATATGIKIKNNKPLYLYMQEQVLTNGSEWERFQVTFTAPYGYYVNSINGVTADFAVDSSFWAIKNQTGFLPLGIFTYEPSHNEIITFNLTIWTP